MSLSDILFYGGMMRDTVRTNAYAQALRQCVTPESVVLDMGAGMGIWALLACQFGARKVYAIEPNDVIQIAREIAVANGYADRIEFIQNVSTSVTLPERVDVIVTEMHGALPVFEQNLPSIIDARERFLAPGGRMIPEKETLWAGVVEAPKSYYKSASPWADNSFGLDLRPALRVATNLWRRSRGTKSLAELFAEPACWATLDYRILDSPNVAGEATWISKRAGTGHGLVIWFDSFLAEGVSFSTSPGAPATIFGRAFFPWPEPVAISIGDQISVAIRADMVGGEYIWRWETVVLDQGVAGLVKAEFKQSTFAGMTRSPNTLQRRAASHIPQLNESGQIEGFVLSLMNGENSAERIAALTSNRFPRRFGNCNDALALVSDLSEKYSQ